MSKEIKLNITTFNKGEDNEISIYSKMAPDTKTKKIININGNENIIPEDIADAFAEILHNCESQRIKEKYKLEFNNMDILLKSISISSVDGFRYDCAKCNNPTKTPYFWIHALSNYAMGVYCTQCFKDLESVYNYIKER